MLNVLVSGYSYEYTVPVIHRLEENGEISVKLWIYGDQKDELKIYHKDKIWWWDIVFGAWCNSDRYLSQAEQDYLTPKFHLFEQQIVREKLFELDSAYEIRNVIFKFVYYFKSQIQLNNIDLVLFDDIPHGAYNLILYYVAKMLKISISKLIIVISLILSFKINLLQLKKLYQKNACFYTDLKILYF